MLWFTFKVTFGTIPAGWVAGWVGGKELIIGLAKSSWSWSWDLSLATKYFVNQLNNIKLQLGHGQIFL